MEILFRKEVFKERYKKSAEYAGEMPPMPPSWRYISLIMLTIIAALFLFLAMTDIARREVARGRLRFVSAESNIYPDTDGIISACLKAEGEFVERGTVLAQIDTEQYLATQTADALSVEQKEAVEAELKNLKSQIELVEQQAAAEIGLADQEIARATGLEVDLRRQLNLQEAASKIAEERDQHAAEDLSMGLITEVVRHERREQLRQAQQSALTLTAQINSAISDAKKAQLQKVKISADREIAKAHLRQQISEKQKELSRQDLQRAYSLLSPRDGVVAASSCRVGEHAKASDILLTVLPTDSELVAEVLIPPAAVGLVSEGQQAILRFDVLPYENTGIAHGVVTEITTTSVRAKENAQSIETTEGAFRAIISIENQELDWNGHMIKLQSGMLVSADIILEKRKAISWLWEPFRRK